MLRNDFAGRLVPLLVAALLVFGLSASFADEKAEGEAGKKAQSLEVEVAKAVMRITSTAFEERRPIPKIYTCDGEDLSPPLFWEGVPEGTRSFALICDDPDAPGKTWVHWVLYNIPPDTTALPQGMPTEAALEDGSRQAVTDFGRPGYGGPCPPKGKAHRYLFKLYALDALLELEGKVEKKDVEEAMEGHILAKSHLVGTYRRK